MIAYLRGKIINKSNNSFIIDINGIGYRVLACSLFYNQVKINEETDLYVYQQISQGQMGQQALALYGMSNLDELEFFELLISVSGIGPKTALGVMDIASINDIKNSILEGDPSLLSQASGIGKKTAERAVLELRNKIGDIAASISGTQRAQTSSGEELDALIALGYTMQQAREALVKVDPQIQDSSERIKIALRSLGN